MKTAKEVIEWWKEYGFTRETYDRSNVDPLFRRLLERISQLDETEAKKVFNWLACE